MLPPTVADSNVTIDFMRQARTFILSRYDAPLSPQPARRRALRADAAGARGETMSVLPRL